MVYYFILIASEQNRKVIFVSQVWGVVATFENFAFEFLETLSETFIQLQWGATRRPGAFHSVDAKPTLRFLFTIDNETPALLWRFVDAPTITRWKFSARRVPPRGLLRESSQIASGKLKISKRHMFCCSIIWYLSIINYVKMVIPTKWQ